MKKKVISIIGIILIVMIVSITTTYAANYLYNSEEVYYDNSKSKIKSLDVQSAIGELYTSATDYSSLNTRLTALENNFLDKTYPVGSIYISTTLSTVSQVKSALGGTWESFASGRTLIGAGTGKDTNNKSMTFTVNSTGGEYSHQLTINELSRYVWHASSGGHTGGLKLMFNSVSGGSYGINTLQDDLGQYHNNIQPYITVYMYKRVS